MIELVNEQNICVGRKAKEYKSENCDRCNRPFKDAGRGTHYKEKVNGIITGKIICHKCYMKDQNNKPDSYNNIKKSVGSRRTGQLRSDSEQIIGDMYQAWTCLCFGVNDMNLISNNYNSRIDHDAHPIYGVLETAGRKYNSGKNVYSMSWGLDRKKTQPFDNFVFWCVDQNYELEYGYIFPKDVLLSRKSKSISITKGCNNGWYENYRIPEDKIVEFKKLICDNHLTFKEFIAR